METATINTNVTLVVRQCPVCHISYALPDSLYQRASQSPSVTFYCPNGHNLVVSETENMKLKHRLEQTEAALNDERQRLSGALQEITTQKRKYTRLNNRIKNGVCPECHRHFTNVEEHMKSKHGTEAERKSVIKDHKKEVSLSVLADKYKLDKKE